MEHVGVGKKNTIKYKRMRFAEEYTLKNHPEINRHKRTVAY